jgi:hypothetical protein
MAKGDRFWRMADKKDALEKAEAAGEIADSREVRMALVRRMEAGEITLEEAQAELARIKRGAKKAGKITRSQAWRRG